jgi:hypothetical protein
MRRKLCVPPPPANTRLSDGPRTITIVYGQPHVRGRKVEGGLVPRDTV